MSCLPGCGNTTGQHSMRTSWEEILASWQPSGSICLPDQGWSRRETSSRSVCQLHCMEMEWQSPISGENLPKSWMCISWTSLLARGQTRMTTYLVWFSFAHLARKEGFEATWPSFWKKLCLSLQALWAGTWPDSGEPLAGGYYAIVYINRGDLDWMAGHFHLRHPSSNFPCSLCGCSKNEEEQQPWTDCNTVPSWLASCWTDEALTTKKQAH